MTTENISVTLGVDYNIDLDATRFIELFDDSVQIMGEIRESSSKELVVSFEVLKGSSNIIHVKIPSSETKDIVINKQVVYVYDIIARDGENVYMLVNGNVDFNERFTAYEPLA
jgi:hypothetical protein